MTVEEAILLLFTRDTLAAGVITAVLRHDGWPFRWVRAWDELVAAVDALPVRALLFACPAACPAAYAHCSALCRSRGLPFAVATGDRDPAARALAALRGAVVIPEPVSPYALREKVRELLRAPAGRSDPDRPVGLLRVSRDAVVDFDRREVHYRGLRLPLSAGEYRLLSLLAGQPGRLFSVDELVCALPGEPGRGDGAAARHRLYVWVRGLRDKLGDRERRILRNVHGQGYRLEVPTGLAPDLPPPARACGRPVDEGERQA